jgi:hypothetical protein
MKRVRTTLKERHRVIQQALVQLFNLQLENGATPSDLRRLSLRCIKLAQEKMRVHASQAEVLDAQDYGSVLKTWHRETNFLSKEGLPRPLRVDGKHGLRRLIGMYYPKNRFRMVLNSLKDAGLIAEVENGAWVPTERCAVFPRLNTELLAHLAEGISRLIDTMTRNVTSKKDEVPLFERSAKVKSLDAGDMPAFRSFVSDQANAFLSTVDDWLEAHARKGRKRRARKCTAGVFTFAFIEEAGLRARSRYVRRRPKLASC